MPADPTGPQAADTLQALRAAAAEQLDQRQDEQDEHARDGDVNLIDVLDGQPTVSELQEHLDAYDHAITALHQVERLQAFEQEVRAALPLIWRKADPGAPVLRQIAAAVRALDQTASAHIPSQELLGQVERLRQDHGGP